MLITRLGWPEGSWSLPLTEKSSLPGPNGSRVTLKKWMEDSANSDRASSVFFVLKSWAAKRTHSAFFTLGLQITLPEKKDNKTATFSKFFMPAAMEYHFQFCLGRC